MLSLSLSTDLKAAEQYGWVNKRYHGPVPYYVGNPRIIEPNQDIYPRAYPYGYFGVHYRPYTVSHHNYYNDYSQLSYRQGY